MRSALAVVACLLCFAAAAPPSTQPTLDQKCRSVADTWKQHFATEHMASIISPPFIVAGDGGDVRINRYLNQTIRAAADAMQRKYFDRAKPDKPIVILLFESDEPYRRLAKQWFGDEDISRFGYFRHDNVMLMNVGTGTGTLVHELTHALIKPDFPQVPAWFNEGLGSLFEQCTLTGGDIRGLVNWRLPDLQRAIRKDELRSIEGLVKEEDFYGHELVGINYAQARYLLMYLQETSRLQLYYKLFREKRANDPTGLKQLQAVIAPQSIDDFETEWRRWVLRQRFE